MKLRLLTTLFATAMLGGCATYDYSAGSAPGGYYSGRPTVEYIGPYSGGYGYGGGYGGLSYGFGGYGRYGYLRPFYGMHGGYYPYYPHRPQHQHPPRPRPETGQPDRPHYQGGQLPPWRNPDGRPLQIQPRPGFQGVPESVGRPGFPDRPPQVAVPAPRPMGPRPERPPMVERQAPIRERAGSDRIRTEEP